MLEKRGRSEKPKRNRRSSHERPIMNTNNHRSQRSLTGSILDDFFYEDLQKLRK